jgi:hypothetical protein
MKTEVTDRIIAEEAPSSSEELRELLREQGDNARARGSVPVKVIPDPKP